MRRTVLALAALALMAALAAAVAQGGDTAVAPGRLTIAYQPGLGYAPLILMKQEKTIEKRFPGTNVDWRVLGSGTSITNGVISGDIQIGAVGVAPMLVGWARGVTWRVIAPLNKGDLWLMATDPDIKTIADLKGRRIATPSRTSIQAVTLRKMAEVTLGDARALDAELVDMDHPDAMQALLTGQIDAHFTSPPFQFQEKMRGAHIVARSYDYFGAHTFLVTVMTQKFYDAYPQFARAFYDSVVAIETLIKKNPDRVAKVLAQDAGGSPTARQFKPWIVNPALTWTTQPRGLMRTATFMFRTNQIEKKPPNWRQLVFPPVYPTKGS